MSGYISRKMLPPVSRAEQLATQLAAYEDELRRAYALLWQKQAALDAADCMISKLRAQLQARPQELEVVRGEDTNSSL